MAFYGKLNVLFVVAETQKAHFIIKNNIFQENNPNKVFLGPNVAQNDLQTQKEKNKLDCGVLRICSKSESKIKFYFYLFDFWIIKLYIKYSAIPFWHMRWFWNCQDRYRKKCVGTIYVNPRELFRMMGRRIGLPHVIAKSYLQFQKTLRHYRMFPSWLFSLKLIIVWGRNVKLIFRYL